MEKAIDEKKCYIIENLCHMKGIARDEWSSETKRTIETDDSISFV